MTTWTLRSASPAKTRCDTVVVGVVADESGPRLAPGADDVAEAYGRRLSPLLATLGVTGKAGECVKVPTAGAIASPVLVLAGLGSEVSPVAVRRAAGAAARTVSNAASVALALPAESAELVRAVTEGYELGGYTFTAYKSGSAPGKGSGKGGAKAKTSAKTAAKTAAKAEAADKPTEVVVLSAAARKKDVVTAFAEAQVLATAVATCRDWVNTPPNDLRPPGFAERISALVGERPRGAAKVEVEVLDEQQLAALGCGGILSVGQGSDAPPRLVRVSYAPDGAGTHLALVGKGITFDTGGLSIKPATNMHHMKSDMAGAAAVVATTLAIADLGLPLRVTAYAALAENMVGSGATRPGDVVTMYGGTTVEILNTDAEGRMVLGDALVMATEQEPDVVLDVATLTGHMVVALGDRVGGVMGDPTVVEEVLAAAEVAGEDHWPMPIPEAMDERIHSSPIADLAQHDWVRWGGGLYAAAFLREFTAGLPWAHLDIAGPAYNTGGPTGHLTSGGTGVAVTTLVEYARALSTR